MISPQHSANSCVAYTQIDKVAFNMFFINEYTFMDVISGIGNRRQNALSLNREALHNFYLISTRFHSILLNFTKLY